MSTSVEQRTQSDDAESGWQPRAALREAMQRIATIAADDPTAVVSDRSMTFENAGERTTISAAPIGVDTIDGQRIEEIITIRTPLTAFKMIDEKDYSLINIFALTGAVVRDADGEDLVISRLPLFRGDEEALECLYTRLIADAARLQPLGPLAGLYQFEGRGQEYGAAWLGIPCWNEPSYWGRDEFECAANLLSAQGTCANAGNTGITAEFPWEQGAVSAVAGDRTSLLQIGTDQPHPLAGNGLFYRLSLPANFSDEEARASAAKLNRAELEAFDAPPFFGAWCAVPQSGTVSFVGFWPNLLYQPGTVANIAFWSMARNRFAKQTLGKP